MVLSSNQIKGYIANAKGKARNIISRARDGWDRKIVGDNHKHGWAMGYSDFNKQEIGVNIQKGDILNTIIHEELHRKHPNMSEESVIEKSFEQEKKLTISKAIQLLENFK